MTYSMYKSEEEKRQIDCMCAKCLITFIMITIGTTGLGWIIISPWYIGASVGFMIPFFFFMVITAMALGW